MTGKFSGLSKETLLKTFLQAPSSICDLVDYLGDAEQTPESLFSNVEPLVCHLYGSPYNNVEDTRWFLFLKEVVPEQMPPIKSALIQHILRAHYIGMIWKCAAMSHSPSMDPCDYGWMLDAESGQYTPVMCSTPLYPPKLLELTKCNCKAGCKTNRCSCKKNNLCCTEMCKCHTQCECANSADSYKIFIESDDMDSDSHTESVSDTDTE